MVVISRVTAPKVNPLLSVALPSLTAQKVKGLYNVSKSVGLSLMAPKALLGVITKACDRINKKTGF